MARKVSGTASSTPAKWDISPPAGQIEIFNTDTESSLDVCVPALHGSEYVSIPPNTRSWFTDPAMGIRRVLFKAGSGTPGYQGAVTWGRAATPELKLVSATMDGDDEELTLTFNHPLESVASIGASHLTVHGEYGTYTGWSVKTLSGTTLVLENPTRAELSGTAGQMIWSGTNIKSIFGEAWAEGTYDVTVNYAVPEPVSVTFNMGTAVLTITWSVPMQHPALPALNRLTANLAGAGFGVNNWQNPGGADEVTTLEAVSATDLGSPSGLTYVATNETFKSAVGVPAAAFSGFEITVI